MNKNSSDDISFGEWGRQRRRILDLTQQELADRVGCARITLRRIESGTLKPSKELAHFLLEKLGAPPKDEIWLSFARGISGLPGNSESASTRKPVTNLPTLLTTFIGREKEQLEIRNLLGTKRLVTIAGMGGIGKTRLALQVGQSLLNDYRNGVWYITLDSLSDPTLVLRTVASVFDIREGSSDQPLLERLMYSLRAKTTLLIMDNCEHLLDACAQLSKTLLTNCPNLKILTTSREVLNLEGEATYYLPSLSTPDDSIAFEALPDYESIRLFIERASLAFSSFRLTKENAQLILDICRRVDGIPLAIELAAAHVNILNVEEILNQLEHSFALLAGNSRTALPRHQTLRASMDWSWGLLSEAEQNFLPQLSVFAGGWTLDSVQAACDGDTLSLVNALVNKSLIGVKQEEGHQTRYQFHEIVRQYAHEKLVESAEEDHTRTRHLNYFLQLSEKAEIALRGPRQMEWHVLLNDERDNMRAALEWADQSDDVEAGLYLSSGLEPLWGNLDLREGARWLADFLDKPESGEYPHARAKALLAQGWLLIWFHQFASATSAAQECLELFRACKDKQGEVDAFLLLGQAWGYQDDRAMVLENKQQALALAQSLGDKWRQAKALLHLGSDHRDHQRSFAYWEEALVLFREVGDWLELTDLLGLVGFLRVLDGDIETAQKYLDEGTRLQTLTKKTVSGENAKTAKSLIALMRGNYG